MGRKKIQISRITDERNRQVTFNKRKFGVMKKAYELSVLCDCEIALIIFSSSNKLYQYASTDMDKVLLKYTEYNEPHESLTNRNIIEALNKKEHKNGGPCSPDSGDNDSEYQLTPRTEAKYSKIDEDFHNMMMARSQQLPPAPRSNNGVQNYSSLNVSYDSASLLQTSPHMGQSCSVSPRPSSSDVDSVYPTGGMLEMSNGYPHSSSPGMGGSDSPGPPPNTTTPGLEVKPCTGSSSSRGHSPPSAALSLAASGLLGHPRHNLRVLIPSSHEESSTSINVNLAPSISVSSSSAVGGVVSAGTLNTPVIALQTPLLGGSYSNLFGDITGADLSLNWTSSPVTHHTTGLPHLGVTASPPPSHSLVAPPPPISPSVHSNSNAAPSPAPSPRPHSLRIKAEPVSPPRGGPGGGLSSSEGLGPPTSSTLATLQLTQHHLATSAAAQHHHLMLSSPHHMNHSSISPSPSPLSHHSDYDTGPPAKRPRDSWAT
uniref:Myocyte-specific enhancer factor 2 n=1 Tax=Cacopsylla melanoneura TaxID=428564 RepID=A0A8D9A2V3_9HEMI